MKVTEDTLLIDVMKHPKGFEILRKYGFPCLACPMAAVEISKLRIGEVARIYGIDLKKLLKDLNDAMK